MITSYLTNEFLHCLESHTGSLGEMSWTTENVRRLFAALKSSIPEKSTNDIYSDALKAVDWEKVAFPPYSSAECKDKWTTICNKLRKTRTLTELIVQAEVDLTVAEGEKPKMPLCNGYQLFCQEQGSFMTGVPNRKYVKVWAQRWHDLSEEQKSDYSARYKKLKKKYAAQMNDSNLDQGELRRQEVQKEGQRRDAKITKQHDGEEHRPDRPLDSEDEKLSSSEEEGEQMDYDEKEDDEGDVTFDIY